MKYTYREECMISEKSDRGSIILVMVLIVLDIILFLLGLSSYLRKGHSSLLDGFISIIIVTAAVGWSVITSINRRRKPALARRQKRMTEGIRFTGKIIDAGVEMESERVSDPNDTRDRSDQTNPHDKWEDCYRRVPNYWIDVEYFDSQSGRRKRVRAGHMVRSMEHLIGRSVDVYDGQEWCEFLNKYTPYYYVDTYSL